MRSAKVEVMIGYYDLAKQTKSESNVKEEKASSKKHHLKEEEKDLGEDVQDVKRPKRGRLIQEDGSVQFEVRII